jgi:hypothetical protein
MYWEDELSKGNAQTHNKSPKYQLEEDWVISRSIPTPGLMCADVQCSEVAEIDTAISTAESSKKGIRLLFV